MAKESIPLPVAGGFIPPWHTDKVTTSLDKHLAKLISSTSSTHALGALYIVHHHQLGRLCTTANPSPSTTTLHQQPIKTLATSPVSYTTVHQKFNCSSMHWFCSPPSEKKNWLDYNFEFWGYLLNSCFVTTNFSLPYWWSFSMQGTPQTSDLQSDHHKG